jgi:hypothetical protein
MLSEPLAERRRLERNRKFVDSPLEGTGFEPSVPRQEKWSMPSSSDQTRVGRTVTLGGGAESSHDPRHRLIVAQADGLHGWDKCAH